MSKSNKSNIPYDIAVFLLDKSDDEATLLKAADVGRIDVASYLLDKGIYHKDAMLKAAERGHKDILLAMLESHVTTCEDVLGALKRYDRINRLQLLIEAKAKHKGKKKTQDGQREYHAYTLFKTDNS